MKYIDADRLKAEIERLYDIARDASYNGEIEGEMTAYDKILSLIASLQQEQPEFPTTDEEVEKALASIPKVELSDKYKTPDWLFKQQEQQEPSCKSCGFYVNNCPFIRGKFIPYPNKVCKNYIHSAMKEQEQPKVDLEKEVMRYQREDMDRDTTVRDVARHFYELGLNARKEE